MVCNKFGNIATVSQPTSWYNPKTSASILIREVVAHVAHWDVRSVDVGNFYAIHTSSSTKASYFGRVVGISNRHITLECFDGDKKIRKDLITNVYMKID